MSRKWERMVERNREKVNQQRSKTGQSALGASGGGVVIKGRSWLLPLSLTLAGLLFALTLPAAGSLYQITIVLYFVLAMVHFFIRRPYLKINKSQLSWNIYTGEKTIQASEIGTIAIAPNRIVIQGKDGKTRRAFTKKTQLFPMDHLAGAVRQFAAVHRITIQEIH